MALESKRCPQCQQEFFVPSSVADKRVYCSRRCKAAAFKVREFGSRQEGWAKTCPVCAAVFRPHAAWQRCCSVGCAVLYRKQSSISREDRVQVTCDYRLSPRCRGHWEVSRRAEAKNRLRNEDKMICLPCSRLLKGAGRNNPNCKYAALQDTYFETIDTEKKAYLLGWIASDGCVRRDGTVTIELHERDAYHLKQLRDLLSPSLPVYRRPERVGLRFCSQQMAGDICRWLDIAPGKKSHCVGFPRLAAADLTWAFLRGYFDGDGTISSLRSGVNYPRCSITSNSARMLTAIREFCAIPCSQYSSVLEWRGNNALDFLARLYDGASIYLPRKRDGYLDWCLWVPSLTGFGTHKRESLFRWLKTDVRAVPPAKERASDSGFDLTLIEKISTKGRIEFYTTGIKIEPEYGWYFDVVPRSSIVATGYMLANSIGVIDRGYKGPIVVPLIKIDPTAPDLSLPCRLVQIVPRPIVHIQWVQVDSLEDTHRGDGGFGSTG